MSKYHVIESTITDKALLEQVLRELGIPFETHATPQPLYGYQGDQRTEKAHIIIRRRNVGAAANDVGFVWDAQAKRYNMIVSSYDQSAHGDTIRTIKQRYGVAETKRQAIRAGYRVIGEVHEHGVVRLKLEGRV